MNAITRGSRVIRALVLVLGQAAMGVAQGPTLGGKPLPFEAECRRVAGPLWLHRWAQLKVESGLNPRATSPVGAQGLAQFMPRSWTRAQAAGWVPRGASPLDPVAAIQANHGYMSWLEAFFHGNRRAAWGGYNAGEGNIRRAERTARELGLQGPDGWMRTLPQVTHAHASETLAYVPRIEREIRAHGGTP